MKATKKKSMVAGDTVYKLGCVSTFYMESQCVSGENVLIDKFMTTLGASLSLVCSCSGVHESRGGPANYPT